MAVRQAEELAEFDRKRAEELADFSHDFRTPLTLILGPLGDLETGLHGQLSPGVAREVRLVRHSAEGLLRLVDELLESARAEAGVLKLRARRAELGTLVATVVELFGPLAERRGLRLAFTPPHEPFLLWCDPERIQRVVANLLSNALRHSKFGGAVEVRIEETSSDERVAVTVRDEGEGIGPEDQELIFDRFYRVRRPFNTADGGTGLGLPLARHLAELHGGSLTVESSPGEGSIFRLELRRDREHIRDSQIVDIGEWTGGGSELGAPSLEDGVGEGTGADSTGGAGAAAPASGAPDEDRTTVLVIDDHPGLRAYVRQHLQGRYRVLEAADGAEGLARARQDLPDLVVSDVMLPELDGFALCRALKDDPETEFIPVVLLTARAAPDDKLEGLGTGADAYVVKPFDARELLARVENLIALRRRLVERLGAAGPALPELPLAPGVRPSSEERLFLTQVRRSLTAHLSDESLSVEDFAADLALDRSQLYRRLLKLTGLAPSALILEARLLLAAELLKQEVGGVGEVAVASGFKSVSHFIQRFRERFGATPSSWREGKEVSPA